MDRYPCINRYKYTVNCPSWVWVYRTRCENCVLVSNLLQTARNHGKVLTSSSTISRNIEAQYLVMGEKVICGTGGSKDHPGVIRAAWLIKMPKTTDIKPWYPTIKPISTYVWTKLVYLQPEP
ncbi:hypothetical protein JMJ77_0008386 [Colletotrichum scovillei]|uniref:Uncharacterized protein n=1 Tax=Colletotrichum scovillei TaxID=1209932 RepID=A0A9P7REA5_9PEZI|nr:hypothetical protein JMJ77_0008386 [Colletotrichum scovillei]KAG7075306.1 hypothetical protein JMJ76_0011766 [Colletotrichum scovillei]